MVKVWKSEVQTLDKVIKLVDLSRQYADLKSDIDERLQACLNNSSFIGGAQVADFEKEFADFCGVKHCIGASNGTTALEVALKSAGVGHGDEVVTVANTFFATAEAIVNIGAVPIFAEVCEENGLLDLELLPAYLSKKTKAIIPVHLFGHLVNIRELNEILGDRDVKVIEDAAQAHGARAQWGVPGQLSWAAAFSFYPGKNLGAVGDGGAITTDDDSLAKILKKMVDHGRISKYEHEIVGTNARLDTVQAAVLSVKLASLEKWNRRRLEIASRYFEVLSNFNFQVLRNRVFEESAWHLFSVRVNNRDKTLNHLKINGIEAGIHYPIPLHKQPALASDYLDVRLPVTEELCSQIISLPLHPFLEDSEIKRVLDVFLEVAQPVLKSKI